MTPIRVGVLRGGPSSEYEVSLETGRSVLAELSAHPEYAPIDIFLDRSHTWHIDGAPIEPADLSLHVDVVFNALHGEFGEDGRVQQILESLKVPYTGSGVFSSAVSMHKGHSKEIFRKEGIPVLPSATFSAASDDETKLLDIFRSISGPYVIKPVSGGSSVGVRLASSYAELHEAVYEAAESHPDVLIESFVRGREATCGVIDDFRNESQYVLLPVEIVPPASSSFFDHEAKYSGNSREICPGRFSREETRLLQEYARKAHKALGMRDYSRSDFIVTPRTTYILETNSLPGLTPESLFPKSLQAVGASVIEFLHHTISRARRRC
jgi:D-alanine-D-alanine ligase